MVAFNHRFQNCSFHALRPRWHLCCFAYSCLKLKPIHTTYLNATPSLKTDETGFMFDCCGVRLAKFLSEFDKFHYRTQSKSIERLEFNRVLLPNVRLATQGYIHHPFNDQWRYRINEKCNKCVNSQNKWINCYRQWWNYRFQQLNLFEKIIWYAIQSFNSCLRLRENHLMPVKAVRKL